MSGQYPISKSVHIRVKKHAMVRVERKPSGGKHKDILTYKSHWDPQGGPKVILLSKQKDRRHHRHF